MPSLKIHCAISKERTDFDFKELHQWIDKPQKELGYNHRTKRHSYNTKEEKEIEDFWNKKRGNGWGKKAVVEWLFHIAVDNLETAFIKAKNAYRGDNAFNFFKFGLDFDSKWIDFDFDRLDKFELKEEFNEGYYEDDDWDSF